MANWNKVAPFTGAWIEIYQPWMPVSQMYQSHPSRVRGLKSSMRIRYAIKGHRRTLHGCVD